MYDGHDASVGQSTLIHDVAMPAIANRAYLETQVHTASPERRQWMLLDAAVRQGERTLELWQEQKWLEAGDALANCRDIVAQIVRAMRPDTAPELVARVSNLYAWVFQQLAQAGLTHDPRPLRDALKVLEIERETWRELCTQRSANRPPIAAGDAPAASQLLLDA